MYGQPVLRKVAEDIAPDYPNLKELIENMFETMDNAEGVGLAAPQIGLPIKLFIVDLSLLKDENPAWADFKKVFINPEITFFSEDKETKEEGCLSIPGVSERVPRSLSVTIHYFDENWVEKTLLFKKVCRTYLFTYPDIVGFYIIEYRKEFDRKSLKGTKYEYMLGESNECCD